MCCSVNVTVHDELKLGGSVRVPVLTSDLGVERDLVVGGLLELDALCKFVIGCQRRRCTSSVRYGRDERVSSIIFPGKDCLHHVHQSTYVQECNVSRQTEVVPVGQSLVVEVGPHEVGDGHDERSQVLGVAVERRGLLEELEFDHVSVVAMDCVEEERRERG